MTTATAPMLSFHGDLAIKAKYVARFAAHRAADEVIQGTGFDEGRGCFVGCTLDAYEHDRFPKELGWPVWLAYLADTIFEGIPKTEAAQFGTDILAAVPVGVDLEPVRNRFLLTVQRRNLERIKDKTTPGAAACIEAVKTVITLLEKDEPAESAAWSAARSAAESAARSAAESAARSAAESAARSAAESAARSAAESAAWSAARSAAWSAARSAEYRTQRDDLLAIIRECGSV